MSGHRDWSWITRDVLEELYGRYGSWRRVAEHLGIAKGTLTDLRRRLGMALWQYPDPVNRAKKANRLDPMKDRIISLAQSGMNCGEIAREIGDDAEHVRMFLAYYGVQRQGPGARPGDKNSNWHGGRVVDKQGYILVKKPDHMFANSMGYVRLHRLVMEEILGRFLLPEEVVHHKDGNPQNNDPENLEIFHRNGDHIRREWENPEWREHQRAIRRGRSSGRRSRSGSENDVQGS